MKFKSLLLAFIAVIAVSCGPTDPKEIIVKIWTIDQIDASAALAKIPKENQEAIKKGIDDTNKKLKGKVTYEFTKDGKLKKYEPNYENKWVTKEGTYKLSDDNKKLTITNDGQGMDFTVVTLTNDNLEITAQDIKVKFIPKK